MQIDDDYLKIVKENMNHIHRMRTAIEKVERSKNMDAITHLKRTVIPTAEKLVVRLKSLEDSVKLITNYYEQQLLKTFIDDIKYIVNFAGVK